MLRGIALMLACLIARPAPACETALLLAVDVSGSISSDEYWLQMQGLADALERPEIVEALVKGQDALSLVHWSGRGDQRISLPWQRLKTRADVLALAAAIRTMPRPARFSDTAIAAAIRVSTAELAQAPPCFRQVIDVSGDGIANDGLELPQSRAAAAAAGITINAIAVEATPEASRLTAYFRRSVITADGFVITAHGLADYPRAIAEKLARELTRAVS